MGTKKRSISELKSSLRRTQLVSPSGMVETPRLEGEGSLVPVQKARLSLNCGRGSGRQKDISGPSIGMDISFENIRSFIKAGGQGVVADMEFLPFRDQTFDLVYGFGILHHLGDIKKGVSEATRVLKNGRYIGFGEKIMDCVHSPISWPSFIGTGK